MNRCSNSDIRELLPDLLHGTLAADARARVEAHVATCGECGEELGVLRTVKTAAVFAPRIDVDRVVRQIPPYRTILPVTERPVRTRAVSWLVAATMAIVVMTMPGKAPTKELISAANNISDHWITYWSKTTSGRSTMTVTPK